MIVENYEKVFTNDESNIIMKKKYNLLNKDYKKICEREGLCMKEMKVMLNEIQKNKELNFKDRVIVKLFPKTFIKVYGISGKRAFNNICKI